MIENSNEAARAKRELNFLEHDDDCDCETCDERRGEVPYFDEAEAEGK